MNQKLYLWLVYGLFSMMDSDSEDVVLPRVSTDVHTTHGSSFSRDSEIFSISRRTLNRPLDVFLNAMEMEFWYVITLPKDEKREETRSLVEEKEDVREPISYLSSRRCGRNSQ
jgi:hypothetical protein